MLNEVLGYLIDTDKTTVKQLALIAGVSRQTVRNWIGETGHPTEVAIRSWITSHPSDAVRTAILREITNNQAQFAQPTSESQDDLDINGDGTVDLADAFAKTMDYEKAAHETLRLIYEAFQRDPSSITTEAIARLEEVDEVAVRHMRSVVRICREEVSRRKQAKRVLKLSKAI